MARLPGNFYAKWETRNVDKAVLRLLHHVKEKMRLGAYAPPFQQFPLQDLAFKFANTHDLSNELRSPLRPRSQSSQHRIL